MSVIISGGGISGIVLALILSKLTRGKLYINLVEEDVSVCNYHARHCIYNSKYLALSHSVYCTLMSFGLSSVLSSCSVAIKQIEISANNFKDSVVFSAADYHVSALGYVVKLDDMKFKIYNMLSELSFINLMYPVTLQTINRKRFNSLVVLSDGREISAQLLIAADGSYSSLGTLCGIKWEFFDYKQVAVVTNITTSIPHEGRAFEIFTPYGSIALLPILNNQSVVVWCMPNSYKKEVSSWSSSEFCYNLQKVIGWKLGCIHNVNNRYFFPLFLRRAKQHISHRLALVGNAAQTIHPIAGQGFNLGCRDIFNIAKIVSDANINNIDIGDYRILKLYQDSRQLDQLRVINMTHSLVRIFNSHCCPLMFFGDCVLTVMQHSKLLRDVFVQTVLSW